MHSRTYRQILTLFFLVITASFDLLALESADSTANKREMEGKFFLYWGYNRANYTKSDIHFKGKDYDFSLLDVLAHDEPIDFSADIYLNPLQLTIPQFNFRIGYYLKNNLLISAGWDHMKYVVINGQLANIVGEIQPSASSQYAGTYNGESIEIRENFIKYEHTDGLNYLRFNLDRLWPFWVAKNGCHGVYGITGVGTGFMMPWSDATFFGKRSTNQPHVSGYAFSANLGLKFDFWNHFFVQGMCAGGHINMPDALTTGKSGERASQRFQYAQYYITAGGYFRLFPTSKQTAISLPE